MIEINRYLTVLLSIFGGGTASPENELTHAFLGGVLWGILLIVAWHRNRGEPQPHERLLIWAFALGALQSAYLFILYSLDVLGIYRFASLPALLSSLDHLLSLASLVGVCAAYIEFFLKQPPLTRRFVQLSAGTTLLAYGLAFVFQALNVATGSAPGARGPGVIDYANHLVMAAIIILAMAMIVRRSGWLRNTILLALALWLLQQVAVFMPEGKHESQAVLLHSLRHWLRDTAIIILGLVYIRKMNQERQQSQAALRQSEQDNRILVEASPLGVLVHEDGRFVVCNTAAVNILRAAGPEDVIGRHVMEFVPGEHQELVADRYRELHLSSKRLRPAEYRVIRRDGTMVDVEMISQSFPHRDKLRVLTIIKDITERKLAETRLRQAKDELEVKYEELKALDVVKEGLIRDVTHELKTPVAKQAMQLEMLRASLGGQCLGNAERIIGVMEEAVRRQENVIHNMLNLTRLEAGARRYDIAPVRIDQVLNRIIEDCRPYTDIGACVLTIDLPPVTALGDEEMLWHVFTNLVHNAIKFKKKDQPCRLEISLALEDGKAVARIRDDGIGLTPAEAARVFERFYQGSPATAGSGIGLTICKVMVEGMGGGIALESDGPGKGATALVWLPAA